MKLGAAKDQMLQSPVLKSCQLSGMCLQPLKKSAVANQGHLYGFGHTGSFISVRKGSQHFMVVQDCKGRSKAADEVLSAREVHSILHPHRGIILGQNRGRYPNQSHPTMSCGSGESHYIQKGASSNAHNAGMAINARICHSLINRRKMGKIILAAFPAGQRHNPGSHFKMILMGLAVLPNPVFQIRPGLEQTLIQYKQTTGFVSHLWKRPGTNRLGAHSIGGKYSLH